MTTPAVVPEASQPQSAHFSTSVMTTPAVVPEASQPQSRQSRAFSLVSTPTISTAAKLQVQRKKSNKSRKISMEKRHIAANMLRFADIASVAMKRKAPEGRLTAKSTLCINLKHKVGNELTMCLKDVCEKRPADPIEYLALSLYKSIDAELYYYDKVIFNNECMLLVLEFKRLQTVKQRLLAMINSKVKELKDLISQNKEERNKLLETQMYHAEIRQHHSSNGKHFHEILKKKKMNKDQRYTDSEIGEVSSMAPISEEKQYDHIREFIHGQSDVSDDDTDTFRNAIMGLNVPGMESDESDSGSQPGHRYNQNILSKWILSSKRAMRLRKSRPSVGGKSSGHYTQKRFSIATDGLSKVKITKDDSSSASDPEGAAASSKSSLLDLAPGGWSRKNKLSRIQSDFDKKPSPKTLSGIAATQASKEIHAVSSSIIVLEEEKYKELQKDVEQSRNAIHKLEQELKQMGGLTSLNEAQRQKYEEIKKELEVKRSALNHQQDALQNQKTVVDEAKQQRLASKLREAMEAKLMHNRHEMEKLEAQWEAVKPKKMKKLKQVEAELAKAKDSEHFLAMQIEQDERGIKEVHKYIRSLRRDMSCLANEIDNLTKKRDRLATVKKGLSENEQRRKKAEIRLQEALKQLAIAGGSKLAEIDSELEDLKLLREEQVRAELDLESLENEEFLFTQKLDSLDNGVRLKELDEQIAYLEKQTQEEGTDSEYVMDIMEELETLVKEKKELANEEASIRAHLNQINEVRELKERELEVKDKTIQAIKQLREKREVILNEVLLENPQVDKLNSAVKDLRAEIERIDGQRLHLTASPELNVLQSLNSVVSLANLFDQEEMVIRKRLESVSERLKCKKKTISRALAKQDEKTNDLEKRKMILKQRHNIVEEKETLRNELAQDLKDKQERINKQKARLDKFENDIQKDDYISSKLISRPNRANQRRASTRQTKSKKSAKSVTKNFSPDDPDFDLIIQDDDFSSSMSGEEFADIVKEYDSFIAGAAVTKSDSKLSNRKSPSNYLEHSSTPATPGVEKFLTPPPHVPGYSEPACISFQEYKTITWQEFVRLAEFQGFKPGVEPKTFKEIQSKLTARQFRWCKLLGLIRKVKGHIPIEMMGPSKVTAQWTESRMDDDGRMTMWPSFSGLKEEHLTIQNQPAKDLGSVLRFFNKDCSELLWSKNMSTVRKLIWNEYKSLARYLGLHFLAETPDSVAHIESQMTSVAIKECKKRCVVRSILGYVPDAFVYQMPATDWTFLRNPYLVNETKELRFVSFPKFIFIDHTVKELLSPVFDYYKDVFLDKNLQKMFDKVKTKDEEVDCSEVLKTLDFNQFKDCVWKEYQIFQGTNKPVPETFKEVRAIIPQKQFEKCRQMAVWRLCKGDDPLQDIEKIYSTIEWVPLQNVLKKKESQSSRLQATQYKLKKKNKDEMTEMMHDKEEEEEFDFQDQLQADEQNQTVSPKARLNKKNTSSYAKKKMKEDEKVEDIDIDNSITGKDETEDFVFDEEMAMKKKKKQKKDNKKVYDGDYKDNDGDNNEDDNDEDEGDDDHNADDLPFDTGNEEGFSNETDKRAKKRFKTQKRKTPDHSSKVEGENDIDADVDSAGGEKEKKQKLHKLKKTNKDEGENDIDADIDSTGSEKEKKQKLLKLKKTNKDEGENDIDADVDSTGSEKEKKQILLKLKKTNKVEDENDIDADVDSAGSEKVKKQKLLKKTNNVEGKNGIDADDISAGDESEKRQKLLKKMNAIINNFEDEEDREDDSASVTDLGNASQDGKGRGKSPKKPKKPTNTKKTNEKRSVDGETLPQDGEEDEEESADELSVISMPVYKTVKKTKKDKTAKRGIEADGSTLTIMSSAESQLEQKKSKPKKVGSNQQPSFLSKGLSSSATTHSGTSWSSSQHKKPQHHQHHHGHAKKQIQTKESKEKAKAHTSDSKAKPKLWTGKAGDSQDYIWDVSSEIEGEDSDFLGWEEEDVSEVQEHPKTPAEQKPSKRPTNFIVEVDTSTEEPNKTKLKKKPTENQCLWELQERCTLVCTHPLLGVLRAKPAFKSYIAENPKYWHLQNHSHQVNYQEEIYANKVFQGRSNSFYSTSTAVQGDIRFLSNIKNRRSTQSQTPSPRPSRSVQPRSTATSRSVKKN